MWIFNLPTRSITFLYNKYVSRAINKSFSKQFTSLLYTDLQCLLCCSNRFFYMYFYQSFWSFEKALPASKTKYFERICSRSFTPSDQKPIRIFNTTSHNTKPNVRSESFQEYSRQGLQFRFSLKIFSDTNSLIYRKHSCKLPSVANVRTWVSDY